MAVFAQWKVNYVAPVFARVAGGNTYTATTSGKCAMLWVDFYYYDRYTISVSPILLNGAELSETYTTGTSGNRTHARGYMVDVVAGDIITVNKQVGSYAYIMIMPSLEKVLDSYAVTSIYSCTLSTLTKNSTYSYTATKNCNVAIVMGKQHYKYIDEHRYTFSHGVTINTASASDSNTSNYYASGSNFGTASGYGYQWYSFQMNAGDTLDVDLTAILTSSSYYGYHGFYIVVYE